MVTCGNPTAPTKADGYWTAPPFGGTSAAAPGRISARRMRSVLTRPLNSSPGASGAFIGVMPDLHKLIANEFI